MGEASRNLLWRNRAAFGLTAAVSVAAGVGVGVGLMRLREKLEPTSVDVGRELAQMRLEMAALRSEVAELSSSMTGGSEKSGSGLQPRSSPFSPQKRERVAAFVLDAKRAGAGTSESEEEEDEPFFDAPEEGEQSLERIYREVEGWQKDGSEESKERGYSRMKRLLLERGAEVREDAEFLWRLSRATFFLAESESRESNRRRELVFEAKGWALAALELREADADVQKMCALTLGLTKDYLSISDSILMGFQYKRHIERALELRPGDPVLHHLAGRWCWAVAELSWWERKAAAALFAAPPTSSYSEALHHFLAAERSPTPWLVNKLYVAKCFLALGETDSATPFLQAALPLPPFGNDDKEALAEVEALVKKHGLLG